MHNDISYSKVKYKKNDKYQNQREQIQKRYYYGDTGESPPRRRKLETQWFIQCK